MGKFQICVPMWCPSSDKCSPDSFVTQPHHRIVRIPPGESVVLNSAERAPYVLIIEFLNGDLDFDPSKRMNKEVLKKLVSQKSSKPTSRSTLPPQSAIVPPAANPPRNTFSAERPRSWTESSIRNVTEDPESVAEPTSEIEVTPPTPLDPPEDEEVDLVEQLYGAKLRDEPADLTDTIVLPTPPKNKVLDMNRWQMGSAPPTPGTGNIPGAPPRTPQMPGHLSPALLPHAEPSPSNSHFGAQDTLSMEDYSERMRTAAVMLAQLNANLVREPVVTAASGAPPVITPAPGASDIPSSRMRLQPIEAAAIRERIMAEMISLEEQRMARMMEHGEGEGIKGISDPGRTSNTKEDEAIVRRELNRADPSG